MTTRGARIAPAPALLAIACAAAFIALAGLVGRGGPVGFDEPVTAFVLGLGIPVEAWRLVTEAGDRAVLFPIDVALVLWLAWRRRLLEALLVALALLGSWLAADAVKDLVARPRPPGPPLVDAGGYAFPSGHSLNSTVTYGLVALVAWRGLAAGGARWAAVPALAAVPVLVGLSRVALLVHYPSDVLGGWLAGLAVVAALAALRWPVPGRQPDDPP